MSPSSPEPSPVAVETSQPTSANQEGLEVVDTGSTGTLQCRRVESLRGYVRTSL